MSKIVIVVFDGLRPDMIEGRMPILHKFVNEALWFREASSVFPSVTRVATTATATGSWPGRNGIINNEFHIPSLKHDGVMSTARFEHLAMMKNRLGAVVTTKSLGETLAKHGLSMGAVHCGSAGSAYLINHEVAANGHWTFSVHGADNTQTPQIVEHAIAACGPLPSMDVPKFDAVDYAIRALTALALKGEQPDVSLVWLPEPDTSFHQCGLGDARTAAVMAAADQGFGAILDAVADGPHAHDTTIIAMSDHGQITTSTKVDFEALMQADGLRAAHQPDAQTQIAITGGRLGEARLLNAPEMLQPVADWLMSRDDVGMIFVRDDLHALVPGSLPLSCVHHTHARSAEINWVFRDYNESDKYGLNGHGVYSSGVELGGGMHGGLNRQEMNTVLAFKGPGIRSAIEHCPAGLVDIAPTILSRFGLHHNCDGGILPLMNESFATSTEVLESRHNHFAQQLIRHHRNGHTYLVSGGRMS